MASLSPDIEAKLQAWLDHGVGAGGARSYLRRVQAALNWVPRPAIELAAEHYGLTFAGLYADVCFNPEFSLEPRGDRVLEVCQGLACREVGSGDLLTGLERLCGLKRGETAADGSASLLGGPCQGRCAMGANAKLNGQGRCNLGPGDGPGLLAWLRGAELP
jgi:NADH:ubiquinone oxidoreductase subunit E